MDRLFRQVVENIRYKHPALDLPVTELADGGAYILRLLNIKLSKCFDTRDERLARVGRIVGRKIRSTKELTWPEAQALIVLSRDHATFSRWMQS